jgi:hypothetical protein
MLKEDVCWFTLFVVEKARAGTVPTANQVSVLYFIKCEESVVQKGNIQN